MEIKHKFSLKKFNTFGLPSIAERFVPIFSVNELLELLGAGEKKLRILGGGSNILLTGDLEGLIVKNEIDGIAISEVSKNATVIEVGGGVVWHDLVLWAIGNNLGGIENLSLIPGSVGASPIQNIGAYGVELKDVFHSLEAVELSTGKLHQFNSDECQFGYRESFFKKEGKGKFFISKVRFKLTINHHQLNLEYGAIRQILDEMKIKNPSVQDVSNAVIFIRRSKLPDPKEIGNSGSFFKNPILSENHFGEIKKRFPDVPKYDLPDGKIKIPAGWLIDRAGWKGKRFGDVGCHEKQALVLVNFGNGKGAEVWELAMKIKESIFEKYGIELEPEVNVW